MSKEIIKKEKNEILGSAFMPQSFQGKLQLAEVLYQSGLCPKDMDSKEKVFVALQYGHELGLSPMISVNNIAVINKRPSLMTTCMMGVIRASGKIINLKEEEILDDNKIIGFIVTGKRKDTGDTIYKGRFTLEDAKTAGLLGKDNWKYPTDMLLYRAQSRFAKNACPELFAGLLTKEEAEELGPVDITPPKKDQVLSKIKENMDLAKVSDIEIKNFEKEDEKIIDTTGLELNENGSEKNPEKNEKFNGKIHTVDELFPDNEDNGSSQPDASKEKDPKPKKEKSNFNSIDAYKDIFDNDRAKNLKESMTEEDTKYFYDLACSDPEDYKEKNYKEDIETIKKYEEDQKRFQKKGRK